jgi:outer membrane protein assembly factor BamB
VNVPVPGNKYWGELQAIDVATGRRVWGMKTVMPWNDGTISTDGGLVFSGTPDQKFYAFDARTGKVLWMHHMSSGIIGVADDVPRRRQAVRRDPSGLGRQHAAF